LKETQSVLTAETSSEWSLLMKPGILKAVIIGVCIAILGQFMGVNAVLYYGPSIFENAGLSGGDSLFLPSSGRTSQYFDHRSGSCYHR